MNLQIKLIGLVYLTSRIVLPQFQIDKLEVILQWIRWSEGSAFYHSTKKKPKVLHLKAL